MRYKILITIISCLWALPILANSHTPVEIVQISDGDTVVARIDKNQFKVRLVGIDCYETAAINRAYKQAYDNNLTVDEVVAKGLNSKNYLKDLYAQNQKTQAYIDFKGIDIYNRILGVLYFGKLNVNETLKQHGGCMIYR